MRKVATPPRQFRKDTGEPSGFAPLPGMRVPAAEVKGCDLRAFRNPQQLGHALEGLLDGVAFGRHRIDLRHFSDAQPLSKGTHHRQLQTFQALDAMQPIVGEQHRVLRDGRGSDDGIRQLQTWTNLTSHHKTPLEST